MPEVLTGREPVSQEVRPPLIELAGLEEVRRTGKVVLALLVRLAPVRRAIHFKPREALRHA